MDVRIGDSVNRIPVIIEPPIFTDGAHGPQSCTIIIPTSQDRAIDLYQDSRLDRLMVTDQGQPCWEGRAEDVAIVPEGLRVTALGDWRVIGDAPYTNLWSDTSVALWRPLTADDRGGRTPDRYRFDQQNRLFIGLVKNNNYDNANLGSFGYQIPDQATAGIVGLMITVEHNLPTATWAVQISRCTGGFGGTRTAIQTIAGTGSTQTISTYLTFTASDALEIALFYASGVAATYTGESGASYARITQLRVVTDTTRTIGGTLGTAVGGAGSATVTPSGGTADIYVGQQLYVGHATIPEIVTVTAVTSTTFTAVFARAHASGDSLRAFVLYGDTIVQALRSAATTLNAGSMSSSDAFIQAPNLDLLQARYEDMAAADIINAICLLGDRSGRRWEALITTDRTLVLRPRGQGATWYVDAAHIDIERSLDALANSGYAIYTDQRGLTRRTAVATNSASVTRAGLTRRQAVAAQTTSADLAATIRDTAVADTATPIPRAGIVVRRVANAGNGLVEGWQVRSGDTVVIRNLPPQATSDLDRVRVFRVYERAYNAATGETQIVPETPLPELAVLIARLAA